jgi:hypothetical protein
MYEENRQNEQELDFKRMLEDAFYNESDTLHFQRSALVAAILHTRDIAIGLGQYDDFYTLVVVFDQMIDAKAPSVSRQKTNTMRILLQKIVSCCILLHGPYGSWKDMKYLLNRFRDVYGEDAAAKKSIFKYIVAITSATLKNDADAVDNGIAPTLAGKWAPREKSKKYGWQAKYYAIYCHPEWCNGILNVKDVSPLALKKCLTHYRKLIATINRALRTPQINQCAQDWASIDFDYVSRTTKEKQELAFKNIMNNGELRTHNHIAHNDRMKCRQNFIANIETYERRNNTQYMNTSNASFYDSRYEWVWNDPLICHTH